MKSFLDLEEFVESMRVNGSGQEVEFAKEIQDLLYLTEIEEKYNDLVAELEYQSRDTDISEHQKMLERLCDRSNLLDEIEGHITENPVLIEQIGITGRKGYDAEYAVKMMISTLEDICVALEAEQLNGNILDMLGELRAKIPAPLEYDL